MLHVFYTFNVSETKNLICLGFILTTVVLSLHFAKCVTEEKSKSKEGV